MPQDAHSVIFVLVLIFVGLVTAWLYLKLMDCLERWQQWRRRRDR